MLTIDKLKQFGADTADGLNRCMNNEELYLRYVKVIAEDGGYERLKAALDEGDLKKAFEEAHALKGVLANLSLGPLYKCAADISDLLKAGTVLDYSERMSELLKLRDELKKLCE